MAHTFSMLAALVLLAIIVSLMPFIGAFVDYIENQKRKRRKP